MIKSHGSLFTGLGGFDLAAEEAGIKTVWQVEKDPFCRSILKMLFPNAQLYGDIKDVKKEELEKVDIISAGPPCQPASVSGNRRGQQDDRWLWHEVLAVVECVHPRWIVIENPVGIASLGEPEGKPEMESQKISRAEDSDIYEAVYSQQEMLFLPQFIEDIEKKGYKLPELKDGTPAIPVIPACAVGAPHRRNRVWIVAHSSRIRLPGNSWGGDVQLIKDFYEAVSNPTSQGFQNRRSKKSRQKGKAKQFKRFCSTIPNSHGGGCERSTERWAEKPQTIIHDMEKNVNPNSDCYGFQGNVNRDGVEEETDKNFFKRYEFGGIFASHGGHWTTEPGVGRVAHGIPNRVDRIKALGNAIVPQIAFLIFEAIKCIENTAAKTKEV